MELGNKRDCAGHGRLPDQPRGKKKLRPPQVIYSKYFKQKQDEVSSYKQVYKLIGQELKLADGLLASPEPEQKQTALILATEASRMRMTQVAMRGWLRAFAKVIFGPTST